MTGYVHYVAKLPREDADRLRRIGTKIEAVTNLEVVRRISIFAEVLIDHQKEGGDIVLCRKGKPDKVAWII
jgi:hypothetical protein